MNKALPPLSFELANTHLVIKVITNLGSFCKSVEVASAAATAAAAAAAAVTERIHLVF